MLACVLLLAACFAWRTETSHDFGYHVATGEWILAHHAWPRVDTFTWTRAGAPYIDMHGLFQIALAVAARAGAAGVGAVRLACALGATLLVWTAARARGVRSPALLGLGLGVALCAWELRFMARPELATHVCLAALLALLARHAAGGGQRWLWAAVPLQLVWTWSHALSLLGPAVLALYAMASLLAPRGRARDATPWLVLGAATLALVLNPYGLAGVRFLWELRTRLEPGNAFGESIAELASPFGPAGRGVLPLAVFRGLLVATLALVALRVRRLAPFDVALVVVFGWLGATRVRNVALFAIAATPVALAAAQSLADAAARRRWPRAAAWWATAAVAGALAAVASQAVLGGWYAANHRPMRFGAGESAAVFPTRTGAWLAAHDTGGRVFATLDLGGWLLLHRPGRPVYADGRLEVMGDAFYREYTDVVAGDGWDAMAARDRPVAALVATSARTLVVRLAADPAWTPVEADGAAVLFVRDLPAWNDAVADARARLATLDARPAPGAEPFAPPPAPAWLARFGPRRVAFEPLGRGNAFTLLGRPEAARREYRRAVLESDVLEPAIARAYAFAAAACGRDAEARAWAARLLELAPGDARGQRLVERLRAE